MKYMYIYLFLYTIIIVVEFNYQQSTLDNLNKRVEKDTAMDEPEVYQVLGQEFIGWYTEPENGIKWNFQDTISEE